MDNNTISKFTNDFSEEVYNMTYRVGNETVSDTHMRVAKYIASKEKDSKKWTNEFYKILTNFKFVPGGRITSNAGLNLSGTTLINCFVSEPGGEDIDSIEGIHREIGHQMCIHVSEGGYGFNCSFIRPRGFYVHGIGNTTPGAIVMLKIWDASSDVITQGAKIKRGPDNNNVRKSKIRKGAMMVVMHCWHPDIEEFITAKQTPGQLTKFNMSVMLSDEFMNAVKTDSDWNLEFPDYAKNPEVYKKEWNGDLKSWKAKGYPTSICKTLPAKKLFNLIMESTYNRNEPGILFSDTINNMNNLHYCELIQATNPCGEQALPGGGVCLLGSINLTQFIDGNDIDWNLLKQVIPVAVRFLDNVNDISHVPLPEQKYNLINKRRIGLGIMGYGSLLFMLEKRYGSPDALKFTEKLMNFIANTAYMSSVELAKEKGKFPLFKKEYCDSLFVKTLNKETQEAIAKYGIRNSHLLSIQPTGNSSIYANNVSGGLEPIFMTEYVRTTIMTDTPEELDVKPNWETQDPISGWEWIKEGDEPVLRTMYNGYVWKIDKNRGLLRETIITDYGVEWLKKNNKWDPNADYVVTIPNMTIHEHLDTMKIMAKYIDSSMSKTVNIPNDYPFDDFEQLYMNAYDTGTIKGVTTYRAGTMTAVLSKPEQGQLTGRPKELECDIHIVNYHGVNHVVLIGLLQGKPYEVFSFKEKLVNFSNNLKKGYLIKEKTKQGNIYSLKTDYFELVDLDQHFDSCEQSIITRLISVSLSGGVSIDKIYNQLMKSKDSIVSFTKVIARTLSKYACPQKEDCEECNGKDTLTFQEGCYKCINCGFSKCG